MKKILGCLWMIAACSVNSFAQSPATGNMNTGSVKSMKPKFGLKAGLNFSTVTGTTTSVKPGNKNGFMIAGFFAPPAAGVFGFRTELVFSSQGFSYEAAGKKENITQQYIFLPQLTTITIAKLVQLQAGGQIGFLLNAKTTAKETGSSDNSMTDLLNKIDYGFAGGVEVYPFKGILIGGRYNISIGKLYKKPTYSSPSSFPLPFNPADFKGKNAVLQFFVGYKF